MLLLSTNSVLALKFCPTVTWPEDADGRAAAQAQAQAAARAGARAQRTRGILGMSILPIPPALRPAGTYQWRRRDYNVQLPPWISQDCGVTSAPTPPWPTR